MKKKTKINYRNTVPQILLTLLGRMPEKGPYSYDYRIDTKGGPLNIHPYDDWVACCFVDPVKARTIVGDCNPYSGKWNFHCESADLEFERRLKRIPVSYTHLTLPTKRIV